MADIFIFAERRKGMYRLKFINEGFSVGLIGVIHIRYRPPHILPPEISCFYKKNAIN
jgi:hypothetical protein